MEKLIENLITSLQSAFGSPYLTVFIVSILPMVEVRGAIPIAIELGMSPFIAYFFSSVSAIIVCPVLLLLLKPLLDLLKKDQAFQKK